MNTKTVAATAVSPDVAAGVAQLLTPVVRNLIALSVNAKQAHWHLRGANFVGLHEFLDTVHENAVEAYDTAAERIVALGLPVDARITTVAAESTNPVLSEGFMQYETVITEMLAQFDATIESVRTAIDQLDDIDLASQDVAIAISQQLDKDRWFLYSHLSA